MILNKLLYMSCSSNNSNLSSNNSNLSPSSPPPPLPLPLPVAETQCITNRDNKFCFNHDGSITYANNTQILGSMASTDRNCSAYSCRPIEILSTYAPQMNQQIFNKYVHDNVCQLPGVNDYIQRRKNEIEKNPVPPSWSGVSKEWKDIFEYNLLHNIQVDCQLYFPHE